MRRRADVVAEDLSRDLLKGVWGLNLCTDVQFPLSYLQHCKDLRSLIDEDDFSHISRHDIIKLVESAQRRQNCSLLQIEASIRAAGLTSLKLIDDGDDNSVQRALDFVLRLWLFIEPDLTENGLILRQVVARSVPSRSPTSRSASTQLPQGFSARNLTRGGGIRLEWTSYLSNHLTFVGKSRLRVFRHISALRKFSISKESQLYPPEFLIETERTLSLLFPRTNFENSKRTRHTAKKNNVDIEAAIESAADTCEKLDLKNYPYWGERLEQVLKAWDRARPTTFKQWWYDRRNKFEWATFWTAIILFAMTFVFGLISSVTGIMQVYASFAALNHH